MPIETGIEIMDAERTHPQDCAEPLSNVIGGEAIASHPHLFVQAQQESAEQRSSERLRDGPEGECESDLRRVNVIITRVRKRLPRLCPLPEVVVNAVARVQTSFAALCNDIKRYAEHDPDRDPQQRARAQGAGPDPARDQPCAQAIT